MMEGNDVEGGDNDDEGNDNDEGDDDLSARHFLLHIQSKSGQLGTKLGAIAANRNLVKFNI